MTLPLYAQYPLRVTNTLSGEKEPFVPLKEGHVAIYACGVTVYDHCHIGHAMQAIFFDVIRNYLTFVGYQVTYVRNYTDVDDKIINKAAELGIRPDELADNIIQSSVTDMASIGVAMADFEPRVSTSMDAIIEMIQQLIDHNAAYKTDDGDVYYRVRSKKDYGKLSNRNPDELLNNTRSTVVGQKADALDFALWKKDQVAGASWESPWGVGRPGWHIECSAMAKKYLGLSFDIHGGGRDLVFPHHENEIAQSESANQCPYATYWLHSGLLTIDKQKMSKSLGNHITIADFVKKWPGEVLRLSYLQQHYSSNVDFSQGLFQNCARRLLYFYETIACLRDMANNASVPNKGTLQEGHQPGEILTKFYENMSNDFGTPNALSDLLQQIKKARELEKCKNSEAKYATAQLYLANFEKIFSVLGLLTADFKSFSLELKSKVLPTLGLSIDFIENKIKDRAHARTQKDFATADLIRSELATKGIEIMDHAHETTWTLLFQG